jgi:uncharacterized membrane protein YphA (DoxX/SURF4 family)
MNGLRERWERYWFAPQGATDLAVCRTLLLGYLFVYTLQHRSAEITARLFGAQSWQPISFFRWLPPQNPGPELYGALLHAYTACLLLGCVGLFTRTACGLAFALGLYVIGLGHNFGKVSHPEHVALLVVGILACSHAGARGSLDARIRAWRGRAPAPRESGEYRWPLRAAQLAMALMFFAAGVAKLRAAGLDWAFSDSFSNQLIAHHYRKPDLGSLGLWIADRPLLAQSAAAASLFLELAAPLALVSPRLRLAIVPGLLGMQIGIAVLMNTHVYSPNFACYALWIPWQRAHSRLLHRGRRPCSGDGPPADPSPLP